MVYHRNIKPLVSHTSSWYGETTELDLEMLDDCGPSEELTADVLLNVTDVLKPLAMFQR